VSIQVIVSILSCVVLIEGLLVIVLYRHVGLHLLRRSEAIARDGLKVGASLPARIRSAVSDALDAPGSTGHRLLIVFSRPLCHACTKLWPALQQFADNHDEIDIVVVMAAEPAESERYKRMHAVPFPFVSDPKERMFDQCIVRATPFAISFDDRLVVMRKGLVNNRAHLERLLDVNEESRNRRSEYRASPGGLDATKLAG